MANSAFLAIATFGILPGGFQATLDNYLSQFGSNQLCSALINLLGKSNADHGNCA